MMPAHLDALDALDAHPHARRMRELCEDDSDPERRDAWRVQVVRIARGEPLPVVAPPASVPVSYGDPPTGPCGGCP